MYLLLSLVMRW